MLHPVLPPAPPPVIEPIKSTNSLSSVDNPQTHAFVESASDAQNTAEKPQTAKIADTKNLPPQLVPIASTSDNLVKTKTLPTPHTPETLPPALSPFSPSRSATSLGQPLSIGYGVQSGNLIGENPSQTGASVQQFPAPAKFVTEPVAQPASAEKIPASAKVVTEPVTQSASAEKIPTPAKVVTEKITPQSPVQQFPPAAKVVAEQVTPPASQSTTAQPQQPKTINLSGKFSDYIPNTQPVQNIIEFKSRNLTSQSNNPTNIEFKSPNQPTPPSTTSPTPQQPSQTTTPVVRERIVEVISDRQEYDEQRRIVTAEGNVVVRFDGAVVDADRLQVNLANLIAVGEGDVALTRGDQVLRGQRFTYNFLQDSGELENGRGEIYIPTSSTDLGFLPAENTPGGLQLRPPSDRIRTNQPLTNVQNPGEVNVVVGGRGASNLPTPKQGGQVKRLRFEARHIDFYPRGWQARDVRITNDPFSPPELELRASKVTLTRQAPLIDRIKTERQRLVFDQGLSLPIPVDSQTIDRREQEVTPAIVSPGYDGDDRGGLYLERGFTPINTETTSWTITPQFFLQKAIQSGLENPASLFGVRSKLNSVLDPKTTLRGSGELTSFDLSQLDSNLRASLRLRRELGDRNPHLLNVEYSYRDRLYNGSLGFQTVQSNLGAVVTSPIIPLGKSGINLDYQASAQYITANSDRQNLFSTNIGQTIDRVSLGRLQASAALSTGVFLWQGKPLAPTATAGLRYTPRPVVPYIQAVASIRGTSTYYTSGDDQTNLIGSVGLQGQIGHFSRPFFDYTGFNISYSRGLTSGLSPFLFDRFVDNQVLNAGIVQQIYGPFRIGFQTSINLDTGRETSTDYVLEYSRRTYGITLRYNPVLELGGFSIRISDFNWTGGTDPFSTNQVTPVVGGVRQE
ncbi:DUF3769 domain-containing protein [Nostoc sp. FACHB-87]|uniref:DUF3769 domain-containing protein n=1 Tax=Nostocaceae TaxID=1162 RepID=UPI0016822BA2|nr:MULTISPECIES: DUF3769 domain-containing protein [Nostocaceae]MBD2458448.1 DUF3769 domain-containing protein [Nostoc sp. FACHB-87]MBD2478905.1 DUF3769 domain-containing protein [Anabaena sp. FACHB-83]